MSGFKEYINKKEYYRDRGKGDNKTSFFKEDRATHSITLREKQDCIIGIIYGVKTDKILVKFKYSISGNFYFEKLYANDKVTFTYETKESGALLLRAALKNDLLFTCILKNQDIKNIKVSPIFVYNKIGFITFSGNFSSEDNHESKTS